MSNDSYLGGCVHAMENPKLDPEGFDNRLVIVNGVLPLLPSLLDDSGGSNSRYCKNLFSSLPGKNNDNIYNFVFGYAGSTRAKTNVRNVQSPYKL